MTTTPDPPWALSGECVVGLAASRSEPGPSLPRGIGRLPGPAVVVAAHYADSPVGPYVELAIAEPARLGLRPAFCVTTMVVTSADSRLAGRRHWGLPKELGTLHWRADGDTRQLVWEERGLVVRGQGVGPALPVLVPFRSLQRRWDDPVIAAGHARGQCRLGRVEVETAADDALAWLAGRHPGALVAGLRLVLRPARRPAGLVSSLRAPRGVSEPAPGWVEANAGGKGGANGGANVGGGPATVRSPRALSSVG